MKKNLVIIILLFIGISAFAEIVPIERARKVAVNFYYERANAIKPISLESVKITQEYVELQNTEPAYYIFNIGFDNGYIIVSAESNTIPVLAYSFEKNYYAENVSPAFNWIVKSYKNEIIETREKNLGATDEINKLWATYSSSNFKSAASIAAALLTTATWDQGCYYNAQTPANSDASYCNHNPTGCVATAMAIIMKYYAWPSQGQGSYSYVHTIANGFANDYGTLSANFGTSTYNWVAMPTNVTSANAEVAKIMYHCGVAVEMDYDVNGSGAVTGASAGYPYPTAQKALVNYFKYPTAAYFEKTNFTDANWKAKIKTEIDASRPILYGGDSVTGGHAFVLDGYQGTNNDYYHFNFGWSGYANGYFYLTSITPNPGGIGGGGYNFTFNQEGIFGISHTTGIDEVQANTSIDIYPNPSNGLFNVSLSNINDSKIKFEVYNLIGEKVFENNVNKENTTLNLSFLQKGVYYLSVKSSNNTITKKITIVK